MSRPLQVVVLGAGGLGGYVGASLARSGCQVTLVARGDHLAALRERGLRVSDDKGEAVVSLDAVENSAELGRADVAFVAVKTHALEGIAPQAVALAERGAVIVPLLNGVEAPAQLESAGAPAASIAPGVAYVTAFLTGPGQVTRIGRHGRVVVGCGGGQPELPLSALIPAFRASGIELEFTSDPVLEAWTKMMVVCSLTAACALSGAPVGAVRSRRLGRRLLSEAVSEVGRVGRASGVPITDEHEARARGVLDGFAGDFAPSLVHDLKRGKPTEVDALNGAISRIGEEVGISTPIHDAATSAIEIWEEGLRAL